MLIEGQFTLQAPIQKVWDSLLDPKTLGTCVPGTEKMEAIDKETYESIVAQRVGTIMDADKIVVLDNGFIAGIGRHQDLLETCPVYKEIVYSQLSEEEVCR